MSDRQAKFDATVAKLRETFADGLSASSFRDNFRVHAPADKVYAVLSALKGMGFDLLVELGGADYLHYPNATDRYGVWYCLANTATAERIIVKTWANDPAPSLPSVYQLWKGSDWMEREVYDMYGVEFAGHPDLRRILMPDEYAAFPLRKDYPMRGRGERHNFQTIVRSES
ncbi:MAG: NADH-quinone oxidoreductase subunit C [Gemmataceae bacterium]|nr:NADH-quinone oxidoreductase subunit C [Gemmataceae bacterium]